MTFLALSHPETEDRLLPESKPPKGQEVRTRVEPIDLETVMRALSNAPWSTADRDEFLASIAEFEDTSESVVQR